MLRWVGFHLLPAAVLLSSCLLLSRNAPQTFAAEKSEQRPGKYIGPGSCAATSCHGSVRPRTETHIQQNEYSTWVTQDKHARAFAVLSNPVSERIGRILKIGKPSEAPKCLACHALYTSPEQRGRAFEMSDGVSCESCHGPASSWLGPHTTHDWPHEKSVQLGMYDTRDLIKRTERCLTCHMGSREKFVDHEMIAAGHPDLVFELDSFCAVMPRHWKEHYDKDPWVDARTWSTGQAVQLGEDMRRLIARAGGKVWPEYSELDCFACHHSLTRPQESWRLLVDGYYERRRAGDPAWNPSRSTVFRQMARQVDPGTAQRLEAELHKLVPLMSTLNPNRQEVEATAARLAEMADALARKLAAMPYDSATALRLMHSIADDAENIALQGERVAEQATMAIDTLYIAYVRNGGGSNEKEVRSVINGLFQQLENPSGYDARRFAEQLRRLNAVLR
jgi:hypothetical protein